MLRCPPRQHYAIGRVTDWDEDPRRKRFQPFLVIVEAKARFAVSLAFTQLLAHLARLRQSRLQCNRTVDSVYALSSDGYQFLFVAITHDGTVKISKVFDVLKGDMLTVLGWLKHLLELTAAMSEETDEEDSDDPSD